MWRRHHDPRVIEAVVRANVAHWGTLDGDERARLLNGAGWLLARKHWEAAGGLELDDTVRGVVAGLASLLVLDATSTTCARWARSSCTRVGSSRPARGPAVPGTVVEGRSRAHGLAVAVGAG